MEESSHHRNLPPPPSSSRSGHRNAGGEIVEVQGGHIVRSTGRKDRHSKVCTAKGPRDRRVRLAAHTAIQFYDVQDRLGYDRPSKAVDWLIQKAKAAIDELAQLPVWKPNPNPSAAADGCFEEEEGGKEIREEESSIHQADLMISNVSGSSSKRAMRMVAREEEQQRGNVCVSNNVQNASFLPPSLDSDAIADTIKSFFPMDASAVTSSSGVPFQNFPAPDLLSMSRSSSNSQDLRLSLQSLHDPIMLHHHNQQHQSHPTHHTEQAVQAQVLLSGTPLGFDGTTGWQEHHLQASEFTRFHRFGAWNAGGDSVSGSGAAAAARYMFNSPPQVSQPLLQQLLVQQQLFSQRGPLQSSNTPSVRAWMDPSAIAISAADHEQQPQHQHPAIGPIYPSSMSGVGFASGLGGFSGFHIPARIQGSEEEQIGYSNKPSSASSDSRH